MLNNDNNILKSHLQISKNTGMIPSANIKTKSIIQNRKYDEIAQNKTEWYQ